jgi:hypothetical protein
MAALNFDESIVLILFAQSGGSLTPAQADIVRFDADLQNTFGTELQQIMTEEGLDTNVENKSLVLGCRPQMPGGTSALQIRGACRYVLSANQAMAPAAAASLVSPEKVASFKAPRKRAKKSARKGRGKRPSIRHKKSRRGRKA